MGEHADLQVLGIYEIDAMIPFTGIGLNPVLQWVVIPAVVIFLVRDHLIISRTPKKGSKMKGVEGCPASSYGDMCLLKQDRTDRVRARYDRISPHYDLIELLLEKIVFRRWRKMVFDYLNGDAILEVGVGTGKNFDFYPHDKRITAIDFSPGMLTKAHRRAIRKDVGVDILEMDVQDLQFDDGSFEMVVATFVFCSVPDPMTGLREIKRVCKKGGRIILLEHVRPAGSFLGEIFDALNPMTVKSMGVNINRNTVENMERAGLHIVEERNLFRDIVKLLVAKP